MKLSAVRKPGWFWTFLALGVFCLVGSAVDGFGGDWWSAGAQLVPAAVFLSLPLRLAR